MFFFGGGGKLTSHQMGPISMAPSQPPLTVPSLDFDTQNAPRFQPENEFLRSVCSIFTADTRKILLFNSLFVSKMLPKKKVHHFQESNPKNIIFLESLENDRYSKSSVSSTVSAVCAR